MLADKLLERLEGVKRTGQDRWIARCPSHADRSPSLAIREVDGRVLLHCFAGCSAVDVVAGVGLDLGALFERRGDDFAKPQRKESWNARDVLQCMALDALTICIAGRHLSDGRALSEGDQIALVGAVSRFREGARLAGVLA